MMAMMADKQHMATKDGIILQGIVLNKRRLSKRLVSSPRPVSDSICDMPHSLAKYFYEAL